MQKEPFAEIVASVGALDMPVRHMLAEDLPQQLAVIQKALDAGELETARLEVHAVRGSAAFCKLAALRDAAERLETSLMNNEKNAGYTRAFIRTTESVLHELERARANTG